MSGTFRLALAQLNPVIGDVRGNLGRARAAIAQAQGADLVLFSELFLSGYPPEDLVLKPAFQARCREVCEELARGTADGPALLIGLPWRHEDRLYNAFALLDGGGILQLRFKVDLPNYEVFDEKRVFSAGPLPDVVEWRGLRLGIPICEDIWSDAVVRRLAEQRADILLVPNGSPYRRGKASERIGIVTARAREADAPLVYLNQVGGQDELVFDGGSFIMDSDGREVGRLPAFREAIAVTDWEREASGWRCIEAPAAKFEPEIEADYKACILGLRDYVEKNRFPGVILGLSGGIDSALCAAMAVDALGAERVHAVMLPFVFTSQDSLKDAADCAANLGIRYNILPISPAIEGMEAVLSPLFEGLARGTAQENLQSRVRGAILMAISNAFESMLLTTGNKSEMAVGYATLYGDMNGGFNPIKDVYKTDIYRLAALRNRWKPGDALGPDGEVIPLSILTKAPTAELRDNQKDEDSLPPYPVLDAVLKGLVESEHTVREIVGAGHPLETVRHVERLLYAAEYKRRQSAPGPKLTWKNFGRDRRYPIVNRFRDETT